jgi:hypothetical protein
MERKTSFKIKDTNDLDILFGEGTGMLYPMPDDEKQKRSKRFHGLTSSDKFKKWFFVGKGKRVFYKRLDNGVTTELLNKFGIGTFRFYQINGETLRSGYPFNSLLYKRDDLVIIPNGALDTFELNNDLNSVYNSNTINYREFSDLEVKLMHSVLKARIPLPDITCARATPFHGDFEDVSAMVLNNVQKRFGGGNNNNSWSSWLGNRIFRSGDNGSNNMIANIKTTEHDGIVVTEMQLYSRSDDKKALFELEKLIGELYKSNENKKSKFIVSKIWKNIMYHTDQHQNVMFILHLVIKKSQ